MLWTANPAAVFGHAHGAFGVESDVGVGGADVARVDRAAFRGLEVRAGRDQAPRVHEVDRHVRPACRVRHGLEPVGLRVVDEALRQQDDRLSPARPLERRERPLSTSDRLAIPGDGLAIDPLRATLDVRLDDADVAEVSPIFGMSSTPPGLVTGSKPATR